MVEGLKLTMTGGELRELLDDRIQRHEEGANWWTHERTRADADEERPTLPDHICRNEAERHAWRADVLRFIRDHVEVREVYRLGADDLTAGELLPPKPGWLEQSEYEERIRPAATLGDLSQVLDRIVGAAYGMTRMHNRTRPSAGPPEKSPSGRSDRQRESFVVVGPDVAAEEPRLGDDAAEA